MRVVVCAAVAWAEASGAAAAASAARIAALKCVFTGFTVVSRLHVAVWLPFLVSLLCSRRPALRPLLAALSAL